MANTFFTNSKWTVEKYLNNLVSCIENSEVCVARFVTDDGEWFGTAGKKEEATEVEIVQVDMQKVDLGAMIEEFNAVFRSLEKGENAEVAADCVVENYYDRALIYTRRIKKLLELDAPSFIIETEKKMLADSLALKRIAIHCETLSAENYFYSTCKESKNNR